MGGDEKKKFNPDDLVDEQVANIDKALEKIEARMRPYQKLSERRDRLMAARRALLGGNRLTGAGGTRLQLEDILGFLDEKPGATPSEIAEKFGVGQPTVSSHLYRHKERFVKKEGRYWRRDPEAGLNDEDDIEEEE